MLQVFGLMFFMDGLRLGLMPLGQNIGATLPAKARLWLILGFAFILGLGATFAVTTGPVTVPLVLAMGLGVGVAIGVPEGFGMLAMASIGPIVTMLSLGLVVSRPAREPAAVARPPSTPAAAVAAG